MENRSHAPASENAQRYEMKEYDFVKLAHAAGFFSNDNLLGEGGFGQVYRATLDGEVVAIKKLKKVLENKLEESRYLSSVSHPHIVKMIGHCTQGQDKLLVLEFVPNKTLAYHLHEKKDKILDWSTRVKIALQSADGLLYLHEICKPSIIHRDMKADNILLDDNFEAKVADFSISNFLDTSKVAHITSIYRGTNVYADPEFGDVQKITDKLDVYSFGVILLELITGRRPSYDQDNNVVQQQGNNIVQWAKNWIVQALNDNDYSNLVDSNLRELYDREEMRKMICCAAASVYKPSRLRPKIKQIVEVLQGTMLPNMIMDESDIIALRDDMPQNAQIYKMKKYGFMELAIATDYFSNNCLLGEGVFAQVYKATLDGEVVAIKKHKRIQFETKLEEIEFLSRVSHPNIIKMIGHCSEGTNRLLVLEFVPNRTLADRLHSKYYKILNWSTRMKIATHSAEGLLYLHEGCRPKIIHRDVNAYNILLDKDFEPKITGFSIANFSPDAGNVNYITDTLRGNNVYADVEYGDLQKASEKSDVFSFGVVLLELITGRNPYSQGGTIIDWARDRIGQALDNNKFTNLVDSRLHKAYDKEEMLRMIYCAAVSAYRPSRLRPNMRQIVQVLQGNVPWRSLWRNKDNTFPGHEDLSFFD